MSPTETYHWHDQDEVTTARFARAFCECFEHLRREGVITVDDRISIDEYQRIMTPKIIEAAEIMLNAPRRRAKAWPQPSKP